MGVGKTILPETLENLRLRPLWPPELAAPQPKPLPPANQKQPALQPWWVRGGGGRPSAGGVLLTHD